MQTTWTLLAAVALAASSLLPAHADEAVPAGPYQANWESLQAHKDPEWFRDAKFGIYTHWGPVTVGSEDCPHGGQWYGKEMYEPKNPVFAFHKEHFGDQTKVGYKDLIPLFRAEKFNADTWADLFARSGAKFAGPVAVHHDNFAMWDSDITPWNAMKMGPHRDITGELGKAIKARGLKFITTFHHGFAWRYFEPSFAYDGADPRYAKLYTTAHKPTDPPSKEFLDQWLGMVNEVVAKYQPDMIWFDFELKKVITPEYQQKMFADYYNWAAAHQQESAVAHKFRDIREHTGILDFERGREDKLVPYPWLTDTVLADWFNNKATPYRSLDYMVQVLVDIVSKNGCMLLDVSPAVDGTIPEPAQKMLLGMGDWLKINGAAIYGTRPWLIYGEGPTRGKGGGFSEQHDRNFTAQDIRFTTKGAVLYAIALGWPADRKLNIHTLAAPAGKITAVSLLGSNAVLDWKQTVAGLEITLPEHKPCEHACALQITGEKLQPVAPESALAPAADGSVLLEPSTATIHGAQLRVETNKGHEYLAAWDKPDEWLAWQIRFPGAGRYTASIEYSSANGASAVSLSLAGQKYAATVQPTDGWYAYQTVHLEPFSVPQAGKFDLELRVKDATAWKPVNIRSIKLLRAE